MNNMEKIITDKNKIEEVEYEGKDGNTMVKKHQWTYNLDNDKTSETTLMA